MNKEKIYLFLVILLFVAIGVSSARVILATWSEPPYSPASGSNVQAPINASTEIQYKDGPLNIGVSNHGNAYGLRVEKGITSTVGGLRIENRTDDPGTTELVNGRMWLRTDL